MTAPHKDEPRHVETTRISEHMLATSQIPPVWCASSTWTAFCHSSKYRRILSFNVKGGTWDPNNHLPIYKANEVA